MKNEKKKNKNKKWEGRQKENVLKKKKMWNKMGKIFLKE